MFFIRAKEVNRLTWFATRLATDHTGNVLLSRYYYNGLPLLAC